VAPKGPGTTLRQRFEQGQGIPALMAVHQERARAEGAAGGPTALELAKAWAAGIGCGRAAVVPTTFRDECETDLFGEQAVLCGGMLTLARAAYETLVEAGYPPLLAYTECIQEIKQVADLLYERGPSGMRAAISDTAEFGAYTAQQALDDEALRARLRTMLARVRDGSFARAFQADHDAGFPWFNAQRAAADAHPMEGASRETRALTPWLRASTTDGDASSKDGTA
jgi:ketol-acid reductoisomerase